MNKQLLRISIAGSVDDGKSTLLGRLLFDSKQLNEDDIEKIKKKSKIVGNIDYSLFTDGLKDEISQGITIDVAYRYFSSNTRKYIIADTPGHIQFTRNMVTGSSLAGILVLLVDVSKGVLEQTKRHLFIGSLMYIKHIIICVNKMDIVEFKEKEFKKIKADLEEFISKLTPVDVSIIPMSALKGENIINRSESMKWYEGPSLLYLLENIHISSDINKIQSRMFIQNTIPFKNKRFIQGRINSGIFRKNDQILVHPNNDYTEIKDIIYDKKNIETCFAPMSISFTIKDQIDLSRGYLITKINNLPKKSKIIESMFCWTSEKKLNINNPYWFLRHGQKIKCKFSAIEYIYEIKDLSRNDCKTEVFVNDIFKAKLKLAQILFYDSYCENRETGSFILVDDENSTVACGMIN
tara:strand:- start:91 stop:1314 length:1224 start_codon:yes stop_codon:yes gene_type:complete